MLAPASYSPASSSAPSPTAMSEWRFLKALMIASVGCRSKLPDSHKGRHKRPALLFKTMPDIISILAISKKGKSRIGSSVTAAIVEQDHHDKLFIVIPGMNQCRWIKKDNDPDFRVIAEL
jgi:hypothetical protein